MRAINILPFWLLVGIIFLLASCLVWVWSFFLRRVTKKSLLQTSAQRWIFAFLTTIITTGLGLLILTTLIEGGPLKVVFEPFVAFFGLIYNAMGLEYFHESVGYLLFPIQAVLFFLTVFLPVVWISNFCLLKVLILKFSKNKINTKQLLNTSLGYSFSGPIIVIFTFIWCWLGLMILSEQCNSQQSYYHLFNAHLKSLCAQRSDKGECPKSEAELIAYNPPAYQELTSCFGVSYSFDRASQTYTWSLRYDSDLWLISRPEFSGGEARLLNGKEIKNLGLPGDWTKLP